MVDFVTFNFSGREIDRIKTPKEYAFESQKKHEPIKMNCFYNGNVFFVCSKEYHEESIFKPGATFGPQHGEKYTIPNYKYIEYYVGICRDWQENLPPGHPAHPDRYHPKGADVASISSLPNMTPASPLHPKPHSARSFGAPLRNTYYCDAAGCPFETDTLRWFEFLILKDKNKKIIQTYNTGGSGYMFDQKLTCGETDDLALKLPPISDRMGLHIINADTIRITAEDPRIWKLNDTHLAIYAHVSHWRDRNMDSAKLDLIRKVYSNHLTSTDEDDLGNCKENTFGMYPAPVPAWTKIPFDFEKYNDMNADQLFEDFFYKYINGPEIKNIESFELFCPRYTSVDIRPERRGSKCQITDKNWAVLPWVENDRIDILRGISAYGSRPNFLYQHFFRPDNDPKERSNRFCRELKIRQKATQPGNNTNTYQKDKDESFIWTQKSSSFSKHSIPYPISIDSLKKIRHHLRLDGRSRISDEEVLSRYGKYLGIHHDAQTPLENTIKWELGNPPINSSSQDFDIEFDNNPLFKLEELLSKKHNGERLFNSLSTGGPLTNLCDNPDSDIALGVAHLKINYRKWGSYDERVAKLDVLKNLMDQILSNMETQKYSELNNVRHAKEYIDYSRIKKPTLHSNLLYLTILFKYDYKSMRLDSLSPPFFINSYGLNDVNNHTWLQFSSQIVSVGNDQYCLPYGEDDAYVKCAFIPNSILKNFYKNGIKVTKSNGIRTREVKRIINWVEWLNKVHILTPDGFLEVKDFNFTEQRNDRGNQHYYNSFLTAYDQPSEARWSAIQQKMNEEKKKKKKQWEEDPAAAAAAAAAAAEREAYYKLPYPPQLEQQLASQEAEQMAAAANIAYNSNGFGGDVRRMMQVLEKKIEEINKLLDDYPDDYDKIKNTPAAPWVDFLKETLVKYKEKLTKLQSKMKSRSIGLRMYNKIPAASKLYNVFFGNRVGGSRKKLKNIKNIKKRTLKNRKLTKINRKSLKKNRKTKLHKKYLR